MKGFPVIPWNPMHATFCPYCWSLSTEWHPAEGWGQCHACSRSWRMYPTNGGQLP